MVSVYLLICSMVFQYMNVLLTISNYLTIDLNIGLSSAESTAECYQNSGEVEITPLE